MDVKIDNAIHIGVLIASIYILELGPVTAAVKNLAEKDITWETVTERLIEECRGLNAVQKEYAKVAKKQLHVL